MTFRRALDPFRPGRVYRRVGRRSSSNVLMRVRRSETLVSNVDRHLKSPVSTSVRRSWTTSIRSRLASARSPFLQTPAPTMSIAATSTAAMTGMGQAGAAGGTGAATTWASKVACLASNPASMSSSWRFVDVAAMDEVYQYRDWQQRVGCHSAQFTLRFTVKISSGAFRRLMIHDWPR